MKRFFFVVVVGILIACSEDESSPIPEIQTIGSELISQGGVILNGEIINVGQEDIIEYGFELGTVINSTYEEKVYKLPLPVEKGEFQIEIKEDIYPNREYEFTAFLLTESAMYKGDLMTFFSNGSASPVLLNCEPNIAHIGDTINLNGEYFPSKIEDIILKYGGNDAEIIDTDNNTKVKFIVPRPSSENPALQMTAIGNTANDYNILDLYAPIITSVEENPAFLEETIRLIGDHFNLNVDYTNVKIGGFQAEVINTSRNEVELKIPEDVNYSNTEIELFAQNSSVTYSDFNLFVPSFVQVPNEFYSSENFEITLDKTATSQNHFLLDDYSIFPLVGDDTVVNLSFPSGIKVDDRQFVLSWKINDIEVTYPQVLNLANPFYNVLGGFEDFPFLDVDAFTVNGQALLIGNLINSDTGLKIYSYDNINRTWNIEGTLTSPDESYHALGINTQLVYSDYSNYVYGLKHSSYQDNFVQIDLNSGVVTPLTSNKAYPVFGKSFAYSNFVYYLNKYDTKVWAYNIDTDTWSEITNVPFNTSLSRNRKLDCLVKDEYVYFANGGIGTAFNDFWRLNLITLQWEQLPDHPFPRDVSAAFVYNNELYFASEFVYIYNTDIQSWRTLDKQGYNGTLLGEIKVFIQNDIPYLLQKSTAINASYDLFMGDEID